MRTIDRRDIAADLREGHRVALAYSHDPNRGPDFALGWLLATVGTAIAELEAGAPRETERRARLRAELQADVDAVYPVRPKAADVKGEVGS